MLCSDMTGGGHWRGGESGKPRRSVAPGEPGGSTSSIPGSFCEVQSGGSNSRVGSVDASADADTPGSTAAAKAVGVRTTDSRYERAIWFAVVRA